MIVAPLLALAAIAAPGLAAVAWAWPEPPARRAERAFRLALAAALGLGLWSGSFAGLLFAGGTGPLALACKDGILAAAGLAALVALRDRAPWRLGPAASRTGPDAPPVLRALFAVAIVLAALTFALRFSTRPQGFYDAHAHWNMRARFLVRAQEPLAVAFSPDLGHADYPFLLPSVVAAGWAALGGEPQAVPIAAAATFSALVLALLTGAVAGARGGLAGLSAGMILLGTAEFVNDGSSQYADVPLAAFSLASCALVALAVERPCAPGRARLLVLAGLAASMAAWTKNEGALHGLALAAVVGLGPRTVKGASRLGDLARLAAGALPFALLLVHFKVAYAPPGDLAASSSLAILLDRAASPGRYAMVLIETLHRVFQPKDWNIFLVALPLLAFAATRGRPAAPGARLVARAMALVLLGFAAVYVLTPLDLAWHIRTSMDRLLLQCWPGLILAAFFGPGAERA